MTAQLRQGFTLIELLIVMAILGVLAVVVLVAINPVQQLARTRDAGRKSGVAQIGRSMEAYYTARGGTYVVDSATWIQDLVTAGEISVVPSQIDIGVTGVTACPSGNNNQNNWCYDSNDGAGQEPSVVFTVLESDSERSKCTTSGDDAYFVWSTADGRGGLVCDSSVPAPGTQTWNPVQ